MSNPHDILKQELAIRLGLQISLSSIPFVDETMDNVLTEWLEHVPMPTEMPAGHRASFVAYVSTNLDSVTWSAYGAPGGFIPKLAKYFERNKVPDEELSLLDALGNKLQPELVGSWTEVRQGSISGGWQFCDTHEFVRIVDDFGDHAARRALTEWTQAKEVTSFTRFWQRIGEGVYTEVEFAVPGVAHDDKIETVASAFDAMGVGKMSDATTEALQAASEPDQRVSVRIEGGEVSRVTAWCSSLGHDVVSTACNKLGLAMDKKLVNLGKGLRADNYDRVGFWQSKKAKGIEVAMVPGSSDSSAKGSGRPN